MQFLCQRERDQYPIISKKENVYIFPSIQWPTGSELQTARQLGCNIVPEGFHPPRYQWLPPRRFLTRDIFRIVVKNPDLEVEWQVFFTKAELYLTRFPTNSVVFII